MVEEVGLIEEDEEEDVVVEEVLKEVVLLLEAELVVLGGTEVLLDNDGEDDEVITELVETVDEVVGGTGTGGVEVEVVLVGKEVEEDCEVDGGAL